MLAVARPQVPHGKAPDAFAAIVHTVMFNVLDYAAGNIPHDHVDPAVDTKNGGPYWNLFDREIAELFDPKVFEGAPSGVQVVCRRFEEEKCLEVMRVVDGLLNG